MQSSEDGHAILHPQLLKHCVIKGQDIELKTESIGELIETICDGKIYAIPLFDDAFCQHLCDRFDSWVVDMKVKQDEKTICLPNGLTNDGCIPHQFGYKMPQNALKIFDAITNYLFRYKAQKKSILSEYSYLIRYKMGSDQMLKCHCDDSDFTLNVCINSKNEKFTGSPLYFYPNYQQSTTPPPPLSIGNGVEEQKENNSLDCIRYDHRAGYAVIHFGDLFHGVTKLQSGSRYNLIHWMMVDTKLKNEWKRQFYRDYVKDLSAS